MNTSANTIFISGGSAGIGLAIAKLLSAKGNKVIINGRNQQRLDNALTQLTNAVAIQGDLSIENDRIRIATTLKQDHPDLNILINNAGEAFPYSPGQTANDYEYAAREINTNYTAIIHFTQLLLPALKQKPQSALVNVTSILSMIPSSGLPTYAASKAALHFYTQSLRQSLSDTNVRVFELMPPLVNTDFSAPIGGENGIPPQEVAADLLVALESDQFDIPVGQTKAVYSLFQEASAKLKN